MWPVHPAHEWIAATLILASLAVVLAVQFWLVASGRLRMPYALVDPDAVAWTDDDEDPLLAASGAGEAGGPHAAPERSARQGRDAT